MRGTGEVVGGGWGSGRGSGRGSGCPTATFGRRMDGGLIRDKGLLLLLSLPPPGGRHRLDI